MAKYCRICTRSYAVLMPIVKDPILIDRIYAVAHVKVTNIDELSTLICNPCLETVSTIWEFYEHVQLTYETLSSKLASFYESLRSCRMCHCKYDNLRDLMNDDKICNRISLLYQIKIEEDSKIPNVVCKPCVDVINFSWKFFSKVQQKQIFLRKKFNINYEDDNLNDLNLGNDSNASSITDSDNLLEELYVVPVQESTEEQQIPKKKRKKRKKKRKFYPIKQRAKRMLQKVSIRKDNAERLYLSSHTTKKSLSELDDTTNDAQDTNLKREEMKNSLLDTNDDDEVKPKTSTSKEFPLIEYDVPVYFCETCSASFETKTALYNHEKRHKLCYYCICCRKQWRTSLSRNQHEVSKFYSTYGDKQCTKCLKIFNDAQGLLIHQKLLDDFHTHACDLCPRAFVDVSDLDTHEKAHQRSFTRSCRACSQDFPSFGILGQHEMSHKRQTLKIQSPYECAICASCFKSESEVREHISSHKLVKLETFSNSVDNFIISYVNIEIETLKYILT